MEFRKNQIDTFIEMTRPVAAMVGTAPSPRTGNMCTEDEYISGILEEVEEFLISPTDARITILNYLNNQVEQGNGDIYNRMREDFLVVNTWVRDIEVKVLGRPAVDETQFHVETNKSMATTEELQLARDQLPPGFRDFTGAQANDLQEMEAKMAAQLENPDANPGEYDPFVKPIEQDEAEWEKRFLAKEDEANLYLISNYVVGDNPIFNTQMMALVDMVIHKKTTKLINENFVRRVNKLHEEDNVVDLTACSIRMAVLIMAVNLFAKEFKEVDVDFSTRKKLSFTVEAAGSNLTFKPANMQESIQFILIKMFAYRPLNDTDIEVFTSFISGNKDSLDDMKYVVGIANGMVHCYINKGFIDTGRRLAEALDTLQIVADTEESPEPEVSSGEPSEIVSPN